MLESEPPARAAEPGDDLIRDEEDIVAIADFTHARKVVSRRDDDAARALDRLGDERSDRVGALAEDRRLELIGRRHTEADRRSSCVKRYGSGASMCTNPGMRGSNIGQNAASPVALIAANVSP